MVTPSLDPAPPRPRAESLSCPNCGAGIELASQGWAATVACPSCGSVLDASDPNLAILHRHQQGMRIAPKIPLGTRGTWHGAPWQVIGFQQVTITVEETDYSWTEYVLFNPYRGFLYLSEYLGHWNVIEKLHERPRLSGEGGRPVAILAGQTFKHFQTAGARTTFAIGEFPWEVRVGDVVQSRDYTSPPFLLSAEASEGEVTWSLGTYTPSDVIRKAFGITASWPSPSGVFANQPNPHAARGGAIGKTLLGLLAGLILMLVLNVAMAGNERVFESNFQYVRSAEDSASALVTDPFTLEGRPSNVEVELTADLDNNWTFFVITLINEATGESRDATKQLSYYYGTDSDGRWSEGSQRGKLRMASVPPGRYFLRVAAEGGELAKPVVNYTVAVKRDVPGYIFYVFAFFGILIPGFLLWIPAVSFEQRRWAESDYAPSASDSSEDDDE
ncbi:MAG: DUF4178 domain-containing protein [Gemmatimonadota bacterium]